LTACLARAKPPWLCSSGCGLSMGKVQALVDMGPPGRSGVGCGIPAAFLSSVQTKSQSGAVYRELAK
jgi:hypothetical protein